MDNIKIPRHLALILDGNGRWAIKRNMPRTFGHKAGVENLKTITHYAFTKGVFAVSAYCFSTENWKRDKEEVDYLFSLPVTYFNNYINDFLKDDCKVVISGDISKLPSKTYQACLNAIEKTKDCKSHIMNICFNYGSHDELLKACKEIAVDYKNGLVDLDNIDEKMFESHLYTKDIPPVDLLIRTSGEVRLSNYLLWQISYAELIFVKTTWPDFSPSDLDEAFVEYTSRDRKFGGINK